MILTRRQLLLSSTSLLAATAIRPALADEAAADLQPLDLIASALTGQPGRVAFNGREGGPLVRIKAGGGLQVTLRNGLDRPVGLEWIGLRGLPGLDAPATAGDALAPGGVATQVIRPLESGTAWFRAAVPPQGTRLPSSSLHGVLVVEEADPPAADLDLVVVVEDPATAGGRLRVNGAEAPARASLTRAGRARLRLVNATADRILFIATEGVHPRVVAIDGQPSELFTPIRDTVPVGPGARFDLMLDMPAEANGTVRLVVRGVGEGEGPRPPDEPLLVLSATGEPRATPLPPIAALPRNQSLPPAIPLERSARATLVIEAAGPGSTAWRLNGVAGPALPAMPLLSVPAGTPVTLGFDNRADAPVPIRVAGQAMRLLHAKDDGWEPYWRDSVILAPRAVAHVAFVPTVAGRWRIESANASQAGAGLRTWFAVT